MIKLEKLKKLARKLLSGARNRNIPQYWICRHCGKKKPGLPPRDFTCQDCR